MSILTHLLATMAGALIGAVIMGVLSTGRDRDNG